MQVQMQMQAAQAGLAKVMAETKNEEANAIYTIERAKAVPQEVQAKVMSAIVDNLPDKDAAAKAEFDRRVKIAELMLKEADLENNTRIVEAQMATKIPANNPNVVSE
jgi:hypothetical protein